MATADRATEILGKLETELAALTDSDQWKRYLTMQGRLHRYSWGNVLLIGCQRPDATHVAGYQAWHDLGRQVRRGEKGIAIRVPFTYRAKPDSEQPSTDHGEDAQPEPRIRFGIGYVFDIAQTDGPPCTVEWGFTDGDHEAARDGLNKLENFACALGYNVTRQDEPGTVRGHCDHGARSIVVDAALNIPNQAATLAHELAHALLHEGITDYRERRAQYETEAESIAYVVIVGLGLDPTTCQLPYLASWSGGDPAVIRAAAKRVQETAVKLLAVATAKVAAPMAVPA